jgi:serine/threonine protein phosphatase 1
MPKHLFISASDGRRFAISDIHGCSKTFDALLKQLNLNKSDQLFLLGDFINRGGNSLEVIKTILSLQDEGLSIYCIRGNHEQTVMDIVRRWPQQLKPFLKKYGSTDLLNKEGRLRSKVYDFMQDCLYYIELDQFYLVHAGFDFKAEKPLKAYNKMLTLRKFTPNYDLIAPKQIIHGHVRQSLDKIQHNISATKKHISIDNGCSAKSIIGQGNLVCLNLDTKDLLIQENID